MIFAYAVILIFTITRASRSLPEGPLILGYATRCNFSDNSAQHVISEAELGVNVINWFSISLADDNGNPKIKYGLNSTCIAEVAKILGDKNLETSHIITVGGWDAPHVSTAFNGTQWWDTWKKWNENEVAQPDLGFQGFDGIDWDLEGNDDVDNKQNYYPEQEMTCVGTMSQAAKRDGYLITMVPPQSYLTPSFATFSRNVTWNYPFYKPDFVWHGMNIYAEWLAKFGTYDNSGKPTFDLVDVQLYETWSLATWAIWEWHVPVMDYLRWLPMEYAQGWEIDFASDPDIGIPSQTVAVPPSRLVIGLSFALAGKSVVIDPYTFGDAWLSLEPDMRPRGAMFWNLELDVGPPNGPSSNCSFAAGLNKALQARNTSDTVLDIEEPNHRVVY